MWCPWNNWLFGLLVKTAMRTSANSALLPWKRWLESTIKCSNQIWKAKQRHLCLWKKLWPRTRTGRKNFCMRSTLKASIISWRKKWRKRLCGLYENILRSPVFLKDLRKIVATSFTVSCMYTWCSRCERPWKKWLRRSATSCIKWWQSHPNRLTASGTTWSKSKLASPPNSGTSGWPSRKNTSGNGLKQPNSTLSNCRKKKRVIRFKCGRWLSSIFVSKTSNKQSFIWETAWVSTYQMTMSCSLMRVCFVSSIATPRPSSCSKACWTKGLSLFRFNYF